MQTRDIFARFMAQVTSGRWLITMAATYCLIKLTHTLCTLMINGKVSLEQATYVAIIMSVLNAVGLVTVFYFNKPRSSEDSVETETTTTTTVP